MKEARRLRNEKEINKSTSMRIFTLFWNNSANLLSTINSSDDSCSHATFKVVALYSLLPFLCSLTQKRQQCLLGIFLVSFWLILCEPWAQL